MEPRCRCCCCGGSGGGSGSVVGPRAGRWATIVSFRLPGAPRVLLLRYDTTRCRRDTCTIVRAVRAHSVRCAEGVGATTGVLSVGAADCCVPFVCFYAVECQWACFQDRGEGRRRRGVRGRRGGWGCRWPRVCVCVCAVGLSSPESLQVARLSLVSGCGRVWTRIPRTYQQVW